MKKINTKQLKFLILALLMLVAQFLKAQEVELDQIDSSQIAVNKFYRHSINLEFFGRTFVFGSLNYEFAVTKKLSFGLGLGLINFNRRDIIRNNVGIEEIGKSLDMASSQILYGNYLIGKNKHQLLLTAGLTNFLFTSRNTFPTGNELSRRSELELNAGAGYQFSGERGYFRLTGYCLSVPPPNGWLPKFMPWIGWTIGRKF